MTCQKLSYVREVTSSQNCGITVYVWSERSKGEGRKSQQTVKSHVLYKLVMSPKDVKGEDDRPLVLFKDCC